MPPPSSHPPKKHHARRPHGREAALDAGAIDKALVPLVPDARDRAFVIRCIIDEGPRHHRGASWALLRMLVAVLEEVGGADGASTTSEPLPIRLPPNVEESSDDAAFPVRLPTRLLGELLDADELRTAIESLRDGPPHHALANTVMALLIEAIHRRLTTRRGGG